MLLIFYSLPGFPGTLVRPPSEKRNQSKERSRHLRVTVLPLWITGSQTNQSVVYLVLYEDVPLPR